MSKGSGSQDTSLVTPNIWGWKFSIFSFFFILAVLLFFIFFGEGPDAQDTSPIPIFDDTTQVIQKDK